MFKFLVCLVLTTTIVAAIDLGESGLHFDHNSAYASQYDNYQPHDYQFDYAVSDPHTGDHKSQWEVKEKGVVRGGYSLLEPDGTTRVVEYIADDHGFRAVVKKIGEAVHPEPVQHHHIEAPAIVPSVPIIEKSPVPIHVEAESQYPVFQAYDGHADNYAPVLGHGVHHGYEPISYKQPVEVPHSVEYHGFHNHYNSHHESQLGLYSPGVVKAPYFEGPHFAPIAPAHVETSVQYHGLTGNPDDDSSYTSYDDKFGDEYAESIPRIISIGFNQHHIKPPLPYQFGPH